MIVQNEITSRADGRGGGRGAEGLANKTDNRTVSYKHRTGRILVQIK